MKAVFSILLSALTYWTIWLGITLFVLPPIAAYFGWQFYREVLALIPKPTTVKLVFALVPLLVAIGIFVWGFWLINFEYNT